MKIEAAMRCLKALVKAEFGLKAVLDAPSNVCSTFASGGGSLLMADAELLQHAVLVLSAVAVFSPKGHQLVLGALDELFISHAPSFELKPDLADAGKPRRPRIS